MQKSTQGSRLVVKNVSKDFGNFSALRNINLDIQPGELVCFLGPSGCGKTTLLRIIAGLEQQTSGMLFQGEEDISLQPPSARDFGIVFQSYALFPNMTISDNVAYGLRCLRVPKAQIKTRVAALLETVGLPDQAKKYPTQLSGGQQQRVALARALAPNPGLLLLDEPLSALDAKVRHHLRTEIRQLQQKLGVTTIMVTHDQEEALAMADRVVVMNNGVIEQVGTPMEIYQQPTSAFVAEFIGSMNFIGHSAVTGRSAQLDARVLALKQPISVVQDNIRLAIRPEDVHLQPLDGPGWTAQVEHLDYLGAFIRAQVTLREWGLSLLVDVDPRTARQLGLSRGSWVNVTLPSDSLHCFAA